MCGDDEIVFRSKSGHQPEGRRGSGGTSFGSIFRSYRCGKALLEKVDITLKDNEGRTALYLAVFGYTEVVKLLEEVKAAANDRGGYILEATVKRVRQP